MGMVEFNVKTLNDVADGIVSRAFMKELEKAVRDCLDRPKYKKPRTVTLELKLTPQIDEDGSCEGAFGEFDVRSKLPSRKCDPIAFKLNRQGQLAFSENNPGNPDQATIDDMDENGRRRK